MSMMKRLAIGLGVTLTACHTAAPATLANTGPVVPLPAGLLHEAGALRPVITRNGATYLWLHYEWPNDDTPAWERAPEGCWEPYGSGAEAAKATCPPSLPVPAEARASLGALPHTLGVIGVDGPCTATVGAPIVISTAGCEPSVTVVAPLTGCAANVAPFGLADAAFDADLRWRGRATADPIPIGAKPPALRDPLVARYAAQWLAEPTFAPAGRHDAAIVSAQLDGGVESLTAIELAAVVGTAGDQCEWTVENRSVIGVRRGDTLTPLPAIAPPGSPAEDEPADPGGPPVDVDGAVFWRGQLAGVVSGLPTSTVVHAIHADGAVALVYDQTVWSDNAECLIRNWTGVSYPCGL
ncbi:MAG: hypothetical protein K8W52_02315 [Deltaproteobacteria bacterium]|nr:hypothetical protein [Deltaproteobacteria bacterium]